MLTPTVWAVEHALFLKLHEHRVGVGVLGTETHAITDDIQLVVYRSRCFHHRANLGDPDGNKVGIIEGDRVCLKTRRPSLRAVELAIIRALER